MGGCFSDVKGGQQAIGGTQSRPTDAHNNKNNGGHNDAIDFFYKSRGFNPLFTQLELSLSAANLIDRDITSKSDPMAVVFVKKGDGKLEEVGRTEVILNNLNPQWIDKITIAYQFEIVQPLVFHVYDVDTQYHNIPVKRLNLKDQDFLGEASCVLSMIVTKKDRSLTLNLQKDNRHGSLRNLGTLTVHAEETVASRSAVDMTFRCSHLDNKDLFSKSDPFLRISRIVETGGTVPISKTEVVENNLNPIWKPDNPLVIECFDFNSNGNHVLIGKLQKSVADLEKLYKTKTGANFIFPSSHHGHEKVLKGQLFVDQFCEKEQFSFLDYISSGFELNFMAIMEVGEVIQFYDSDRRFSAWGFGGRTMDGRVSHCFNLNGGTSDLEVGGVEGIMAAYANALHNVSLAGPTLFGQVINRAAEIAGQSLSGNNNKYYVLLIITDGVITDLQETKDALVRASDLPLSLLVVGVGGADFKQMEINVVQALLEELPGQFLTYMRSRDVKPCTTRAAAAQT
ncbi:hypothetical protein FEM48_Zijuj02G0154200 [Ziziphus jujuba var. spinosa]|uniref:C2 domain-containing protein n=1 Tax=Ziziphus jujuba var. spinosa TaxID=714518 RepID=A0A978VWH0_ZIZJJ|nr:hypothetical protein FEM48_Zijuj02G0154200 [Ziziphus jujuba var. spinosa]